MYTSFYNLDAKPFQIASDPNFIWLGEKHKEALATLTYGVMDNKGFMLLTGDVGTGKTTLINTLIRGLSDDVLYASVPDPRLGLNDFLNYIANAFEIRRSFKSKGKFLIYFSEFLARCAEDNKKILLLIDESQLLTQDMLEEIRLLSNIQKDGQNLLNIFFVGQDEFNEILERPENRAVAQRLTLNYHLKPLTDQETELYIRHRLQVAGLTRQLFDAEAFMEIFRYTGGFPRRINILCDHCLLTGFVREQHVIGGDVVRYCAKELRIPQATVRREPPIRPLPPQFEDSGPGQEQYAPQGEEVAQPDDMLAVPTPPAAQEKPEEMEGLEEMEGPEPVMDHPEPGEDSPLVQPVPERPVPLVQQRQPWTRLALVLGLILLGAAGLVYLFDRPLFETVEDGITHHLLVVRDQLMIADQPPLPSSPDQEPTRSRSEESSVTPPAASAPMEPAVVSQTTVQESSPPAPAEPERQAAPVEAPEDQQQKASEAAATAEVQQTGQSSPSADEDVSLPSDQPAVLPESTVIVRFKNDSSEFVFTNYESIDRLVDAVKEHPEVTVTIAGHTDSHGSEGYNYRLSLFRANMVKSFFLGKGIPADQLLVQAYGSEYPIASNETEEGRRQNRRVEIDIER